MDLLTPGPETFTPGETVNPALKDWAMDLNYISWLRGHKISIQSNS
jgi:hypothetical protein